MAGDNTPWHSPHASQIPTTFGDDVNTELQTVQTSASPGFSFGRSGNTPGGTWLLRPGGVPSNKTGIPVGFSSPSVFKVSVGNEDLNAFSVELYEHDGDEVGLTLIGTVVMTGATRSQVFSVSFSTTLNKQLAARIKVGGGSAKNPGVDLQLTGTI